MFFGADDWAAGSLWQDNEPGILLPTKTAEERRGSSVAPLA